MEKPILGGCLCKKIRYKAMVKPKWISVCHCRMCQRAYGTTSATFVAFDKGNLKFTKGSPTYNPPISQKEAFVLPVAALSFLTTNL